MLDRLLAKRGGYNARTFGKRFATLIIVFWVVLTWSRAESPTPGIDVSTDPQVTAALGQGARLVTDKWRWFQDYGFLYSKWTVQCPTNRRCQVGMGIKMGGDPLGEKIRFSGACEFVTVGIGSIHVRVADGKGPCPVILKQGSYGLVPIFKNKKF